MNGPGRPERTKLPGRMRRLAGLIPVAGSVVVSCALAVLWVRGIAVDDIGTFHRAGFAAPAPDGRCSLLDVRVQFVAGRGLVVFRWERSTSVAANTTQGWISLLGGGYPYRQLGWTRDAGETRERLAGPGGPLGTLRCTLLRTSQGGGRNVEIILAGPIWTLMLPCVVSPVWWLWCPPGRPWPRLTLRRLALAIAASALAAAGLGALGRSALVGTMGGDHQVVRTDASAEGRPDRGVAATDGLAMTVRGGDEDLGRILAALPRDRKLTSIRFEQDGITDQGLEALAAFSGLAEVDLHGCSAVTDAGVAHLKGLTRLRKLNLDYTAITDRSMSVIARFAELEELSLIQARIGDAGLDRMENLTNLRRVNLTGTNITDAGLRYLRRCERLADLSTARTGVTPAGPEILEATLPWFAAQAVERAALRGDDPAAFAGLIANDDRQRSAFVTMIRASNRAQAIASTFQLWILDDKEAGGPAEAIEAALSFRDRWEGPPRRVDIAGNEAHLGSLRLIRGRGTWLIDIRDWDDRTVEDYLKVAAPLAEVMADYIPEVRSGALRGMERESIEGVKRTFTERALAAGWRPAITTSRPRR